MEVHASVLPSLVLFTSESQAALTPGHELSFKVITETSVDWRNVVDAVQSAAKVTGLSGSLAGTKWACCTRNGSSQCTRLTREVPSTAQLTVCLSIRQVKFQGTGDSMPRVGGTAGLTLMLT